MNPTVVKVAAGISAVLLCVAAVGVSFFASFDQLSVNGRRNGGDLFVGMASVFGEFGARVVLAGALLFLAALMLGLPWRKRSNPELTRSTPTPRKRGAG